MLEGKSIAILVGKKIEDCSAELIEVIRAMKSMSARVRVVSSPKKHYIRGKDGVIKVDISIDKARPEDFDAIILCSDCNGSEMHAHKYCVQFLHNAYRQGKLIAAIGKGVELINLFFVDSMLLPAVMNDGFMAKKSKTGQPVVRKDNLIIARNPVNLVSFVNEIANALK